MPRLYRNAHHAIRDAQHEAPMCIGFDTVENGWVLYHPEHGAPEGVEPDFLCCGRGKLPWPLNDAAVQIVTALFNYHEV